MANWWDTDPPEAGAGKAANWWDNDPAEGATGALTSRPSAGPIGKFVQYDFGDFVETPDGQRLPWDGSKYRLDADRETVLPSNLAETASHRGDLWPVVEETPGSGLELGVPGFLTRPYRAIKHLMDGGDPRELSGGDILELGALLAGGGAGLGRATPGGATQRAATNATAALTAPVKKAATTAAAGLNRAMQTPKTVANVMTAPLRRGSAEAADDVLLKTLERGRTTPENIIREMEAGKAAAKFGGNSGPLPETIADLGGSATQELLDTVMIAPGQAKTIARNALDARQAGTRSAYDTSRLPPLVAAQQAEMGQGRRLLDNLARAFEIKSGKSAYKTEKQIVADQKALSAPAYERAFGAGAEDFDLGPAIANAMSEAANLSGGRQALVRKAVRMFMRRDAKSNDFKPIGRADELKLFDSGKRELDDVISVLKRGGRNEGAALLTRFKNDMLDAVHGGSRAAPSRNAAYAEARDVFASHAELKDAIALGRNALREGAEVTADQIAAMSSSEKAMFRRGLFEALAKHTKRKPTDDASQIFRRQDIAEIIKEAMPTKGAKAQTRPSDQFGEIVNREARMNQTRQMTYNSRTAIRDAALEDLSMVARLMERVRQNGLVSAVMDTAVLELQRFFGMREETARILAQVLTSSDEAVIRATMERLATRVGPERAAQAPGVISQSIQRVLSLQQAAPLLQITKQAPAALNAGASAIAGTEGDSEQN